MVSSRLAFYGQQQAGRRDQDTLLLEDYQTTSNGKITYEFIDPERSPQLLEQYGVTTPGQIVVAPLNADGTVNTERAELVRLFSQEELSNAALRVMATGNFRALFLNTEGGLSTESTEGDGLSLLKASLEDLNWTVQDVSIFDISAEQPTVNLQDPAFDGTVLVVRLLMALCWWSLVVKPCFPMKIWRSSPTLSALVAIWC